MIEFFQSVLGTYSPILNPDDTIAIGLAGVDFPYVFRAVFLLVVVYSVLKCIGGIICRIY